MSYLRLGQLRVFPEEINTSRPRELAEQRPMQVARVEYGTS